MRKWSEEEKAEMRKKMFEPKRRKKSFFDKLFGVIALFLGKGKSES